MSRLFSQFPRWLRRKTSGKIILILLAPTLAVYGYMIFYSIPLVSEFAGGRELLDMRPLGYTPAFARELLEALGAEGRSAYLCRQIPVDMIFPGLFAATGSLLLAWLFRKRIDEVSRFNGLVVAPIFAGLFDYSENIGTIAMLAAFPNVSDSMAVVSCGFTVLKSIFTTVFFLVLIAASAAVVQRRFQSNRA